jgi:hypothetical protein
MGLWARTLRADAAAIRTEPSRDQGAQPRFLAGRTQQLEPIAVEPQR